MSSSREEVANLSEKQMAEVCRYALKTTRSNTAIMIDQNFINPFSFNYKMQLLNTRYTDLERTERPGLMRIETLNYLKVQSD